MKFWSFCLFDFFFKVYKNLHVRTDNMNETDLSHAAALTSVLLSVLGCTLQPLHAASVPLMKMR